MRVLSGASSLLRGPSLGCASVVALASARCVSARWGLSIGIESQQTTFFQESNPTALNNHRARTTRYDAISRIHPSGLHARGYVEGGRASQPRLDKSPRGPPARRPHSSSSRSPSHSHAAATRGDPHLESQSHATHLCSPCPTTQISEVTRRVKDASPCMRTQQGTVSRRAPPPNQAPSHQNMDATVSNRAPPPVGASAPAAA